MARAITRLGSGDGCRRHPAGPWGTARISTSTFVGNPIGLIDLPDVKVWKAQLWISEAKAWSRRVIATTAGQGFTP